MNPAPTPFAEALRARLDERGENATAAAAYLGVNASTVTRWLRGSVPETIDHHLLANYLGISPTDVANLIGASRGAKPRPRPTPTPAPTPQARRSELAELRDTLTYLLGRIEDLVDRVEALEEGATLPASRPPASGLPESGREAPPARPGSP